MDKVTLVQSSSKISQNQIAIATAINHQHQIDPKETIIVYSDEDYSCMYLMDLVKLLAFSIKLIHINSYTRMISEISGSRNIYGNLKLHTDSRFYYMYYSDLSKWSNEYDRLEYEQNEIYIIKSNTNQTKKDVNNTYINLLYDKPEEIFGYGKPDKNGQYMNTPFLYKF